MAVNRPQTKNSGQTVSLCLKNLAVRRKDWLELDGEFVIGEGGFDLLNAVTTTGSLTAATKVVGWSYRHAWGYLRRAETALDVRLTTPAVRQGAPSRYHGDRCRRENHENRPRIWLAPNSSHRTRVGGPSADAQRKRWEHNSERENFQRSSTSANGPLPAR